MKLRSLEAAEIWEDWEEQSGKIRKAIADMFLDPTNISVDQAHSILISANLLTEDLHRLSYIIKAETDGLTTELMDVTDKLSRTGG